MHGKEMIRVGICAALALAGGMVSQSFSQAQTAI